MRIVIRKGVVMIRKVACILIFICMLGVFGLAMIFADQIATTADDRKVRLKDNGNWEYINDTKEKVEFIDIDGRLREELRSYIENKDPVLTKQFELYVNWGHPDYVNKYKSVMKGFYLISKKRDPDIFSRELTKAFGLKAANDILWIVQH